MELLSPAGNREAFIAAIQAGADAVYLGGKAFSARQPANNFDKGELAWALDYAHERGRKIYVAVNTLIGQHEWQEAVEYIHELAGLYVDALIMQDLGLMAYAVKHLPVPLHVSTQATITSAQGAAFFKSMGVSRVILAREAHISEIEQIAGEGGVEVEVFVHGALCVSVSGQCLFSSMVGGRSGNRGRCAQPCRLPYTLHHNKGQAAQGYSPPVKGNLLSPKDLMTMERLLAFKKAGVTSLKIEGRLKSTPYVAIVTEAYRKAIDRLADGYDIKTCGNAADLRLFGNRDGFTTGYAFRESNDFDLMSKLSQPRTGEELDNIKLLAQKADAIVSGESTSVPLEAHAVLSAGKPCILTLTDGVSGLTVTVEGAVVQEAKTKALSAEDVQKQLSKTGGTIYSFDPLNIDLDEGAYIAASEMNALRRDAVEKMRRLRIEKARSYLAPVVENSMTRASNKWQQERKRDRDKLFPILIAQTADLSCVGSLLDAGADHIYWQPEDYRAEVLEKSLSEYARYMGKISFVLPNYLTTGEQEAIPSFDSVVAANAGQLSLPNVIAADYTLNVFNARALEYINALGNKRMTLSPELTLSQAYVISKEKSEGKIGACGIEIIAYGRIPLMTLKHCPLRANGIHACAGLGEGCGISGGGCAEASEGHTEAVLSDRIGMRFPLRRYITSEGCTVRVLNSLPISIHKKAGAFDGLADAWRLMFYTENDSESREIVSYYRSIIDHKEAIPPPILSKPTTAGHWFRGVE